MLALLAHNLYWLRSAGSFCRRRLDQNEAASVAVSSEPHYGGCRFTVEFLCLSAWKAHMYLRV